MDRHLLPDEIDQLLDGEAGFGTAPLKAHARRCPECRQALADARELVHALEHLAYIAPSAGFAGRVMSRVQIYVPWHVAALDLVRGWVPRSRPARIAAGLGLGSAAAVLTLAMLWLATRGDAVMFVFGLASERVRGAALSGLSAAVTGAVGAAGFEALRGSGMVGVLVTAALLTVIATLSAKALRLISGSRQAR